MPMIAGSGADPERGSAYQGAKTTSSPSLGGQTLSKSTTSQGSGMQKDAAQKAAGGFYGPGNSLVQGRPGTAYEGLAYAGSDLNDYLGIGNDFWDRVGNFGAGMLGVSELDPRAYGASQPGMGADYGFDAIGAALGLVTGIPGTGMAYRALTGGSTDINLGPDVFGGMGDFTGGLDGVGASGGGGGGGYPPQRSPTSSNSDLAYRREMEARRAREADLDRSVTALLDTPLPAAGAAGPVAPTGPGAPAVPESWYTIRGMASGGAVYPEGTDYLGNIGKPRLDRWYSPGSDWKPSLYYNNDLGGLPADYLPNNVVTWGTGDRIGPGIHNPTSTPGNPNGTNPPPAPPPVTPPVTPPVSTGNPSWWHAPMTYADFMSGTGGGKWAQDLRARLGSGWTPTQRQVDQWDADTADEAWGSGAAGMRPRTGFQDGGMLEVDGRMLPVERVPASPLTGFMMSAVPIRDDIPAMPVVPPAVRPKAPDKTPGTARARAAIDIRMRDGMPSPKLPGDMEKINRAKALLAMYGHKADIKPTPTALYTSPDGFVYADEVQPTMPDGSRIVSRGLLNGDTVWLDQNGRYLPRDPLISAINPTPAYDMSMDGYGKGPLGYKSGRVKAPGGGRDDLGVARHDSGDPIALADGEYVLPADYVAARGQGSTDHGARVLDQEVIKMRGAEAKRLKSLPPPKR